MQDVELVSALHQLATLDLANRIPGIQARFILYQGLLLLFHTRHKS
jgi:hypothetical protein